MEKLSSSLRLAIEERPTKTILRNEDDTLHKQIDKIAVVKPIRKIPIPSEFDGRKIWKGLLTPVKDQGRCGSCWAFASTGMLADRFNIQSMGMINIQLSPTKLILCGWQGDEIDTILKNKENDVISKLNTKAYETSACYGNTLYDACRYLFEIGTTTENCVPYDKNLGRESKFQKISLFKSPVQLPLCSQVTGPLGDMCSNFFLDQKTGEEGGNPSRFYKALHFYSLMSTKQNGGSELNICDDIYKWGPIATGMKVYSDFYTFDPKNDIYEWNGSGEQVGGHAVVIVGWGNKNNIDYWIIRNSWGVNWGIDGYFLMKRGNNMCDIESNCMGVVPDFFYPINYKWATEIHTQKFFEEQKLHRNRVNIATKLDITAGGIDPNTGYSRRVLSQFPWLDIERPVDLNKLPKWNKFIAGIDSSVPTKQKIYNSTNINVLPIFVLILLVLILLVLILVILFLLLKRN